MDLTALKFRLSSLIDRVSDLRGGYFDIDAKLTELKRIDETLAKETTWSDLELTQQLNKQRAPISKLVETFKESETSIQDALELFELLDPNTDHNELSELESSSLELEKAIEKLEFNRMFTNPMDANSAYLNIQSGSGGTEAQDWAQMIMRMYVRWAESRNFSCNVMETHFGEVAGIKSATLFIEGSFAYGWLRTETGVHRLVRKSPFDSGNRRHTSFASVFVSPEIDDSIEVEINTADVRVDTYRSSGAGGQHVNKTDSAVRLTHIPTGVVVQCQNDRSQHKNKENAYKQLKSKLYELELQKQKEEQQKLEDSKSDIGWGSQIRSYVLDQSRIKDLRTGIETGNTQAFLDGDLDDFMEASLKQGV
ncbi:MAG: peptide chain release factor 2 [Gammaproteobacteria bacterium]